MIETVSPAVEESYLTEKQGILSWLLTTDHKRIAILYTISITAGPFTFRSALLIPPLILLPPRSVSLSPVFHPY